MARHGTREPVLQAWVRLVNEFKTVFFKRASIDNAKRFRRKTVQICPANEFYASAENHHVLWDFQALASKIGRR